MPHAIKDVCFRKRNQALVHFKAKYTPSPCKAGEVVRKRMSKKEAAVHKRVGEHERIPNLASMQGNTGVMPNKGVALRDIGGRRGRAGGKQIVLQNIALLRSDLTAALQHLKSKGIKHKDLKSGASRNVLWDGQHFNVIDFGLVKDSSDYDVHAQVTKVIGALLSWANS